jgi:hypothetical protein
MLQLVMSEPYANIDIRTNMNESQINKMRE